MEMFTRDMVLTGPPDQVRNWATGIASAFGDATGTTPSVWTSIAGGTAGHHTWSMQVDGAGEVVDLTMQALGDADYLATIEEGRQFFTGQPHDTIYRPFGELGEDASQPGNVAMVTTADAEAGSLGHAVGWGLEVNEYVSQLTGLPSTLLGMAAGSFSRLTWMGIAPDARAADEASRTMNADDGYLKLIARGGQYFVDRSARTQLFLRIA
jgi:hypothetical protein